MYYQLLAIAVLRWDFAMRNEDHFMTIKSDMKHKEEFIPILPQSTELQIFIC